MLESALILIQPQFFLMDASFQTENAYKKIKFDFPINDLLAILGLFKIYIIFRNILINSFYMSNRCSLSLYLSQSHMPDVRLQIRLYLLP